VDGGKTGSQPISNIIITRTTQPDGSKKDMVDYASSKALEAVGKVISAGLDTVRLVLPDKDDKVDGDYRFKFIPVKNANAIKSVQERAMKEKVVQAAAGAGNIKVVGRPMTIETGVKDHPVDLILPLPSNLIPTDAAEREAFLSHLVIFIEHSDGEKVLV